MAAPMLTATPSIIEPQYYVHLCYMDNPIEVDMFKESEKDVYSSIFPTDDAFPCLYLSTLPSSKIGWKYVSTCTYLLTYVRT
jgi:hypothetical protein